MLLEADLIAERSRVTALEQELEGARTSHKRARIDCENEMETLKRNYEVVRSIDLKDFGIIHQGAEVAYFYLLSLLRLVEWIRLRLILVRWQIRDFA